jgi:glucosamine-6-phosphate deaminase
MRTILAADREAMGRWVAEHAAADLRLAIQEHGAANIVVATGASQFEVLRRLDQV